MTGFLRGVSPHFLRSQYREYLQRTDRLRKHTLGPGETPAELPRAATEADGAFLDSSLRSATALQAGIVKTCMIILGAAFLLHVILILYSLTSDQLAIGTVGGGLLVWPVVWPILRWLRRLWIDSVFIDITRNVLRDFPPEEAVKVIEIIYRGSVLPRNGGLGLKGRGGEP